MDDPEHIYVLAIEWALLIAVPVLGILTLFSWYEAHRLWPYRVPALLAISNTIVGAAATWMAWTVLYREQFGVAPDIYLPLTATAVLVLCLVPWVTTVYLVYLEARRRDG